MADSATHATREAAILEGITRIHDRLQHSLRSLQLDERLARTTGTDLPDVSERLDAVVKLTEDAAHKTLDLSDEARELVAQLLRAPQTTKQRERTQRVNQLLSEISLAQSYQDLTGQIIRRVVAIVGDTEDALRTLLEAAGLEPRAENRDWDGEACGPAVTSEDAGVSQDDADDLLSGLGL
ncbi:MAG: protein phosphatase CheZ [Salinisphaeraceae bacterium]|nr:protein phosphatase CheZ [Salinisphaeraceae bacterium]